MTPETWITLFGVGVASIATIIAGIWQLSRSEARLQQSISDHRVTIQGLIDTDRRITAESVQAVRQKIADVELESFKTFVRRDSFHEIMNRVSAENAAFKEAIEARLDRQEVKIDKLIERGN